jgi:acetylornithine deacetylase/succinyl-diaminopimelate desuccinylase-like protein
LAATADVRRILEAIRQSEPEVIREQIRLCEIPAPPFNEEPRARAYAEGMRAAGLAAVRIDREGNVIGELRGRNASPHLVLSAHLDTVFPADLPVRVSRDGNMLRGPGIGDDCRGLAVVLAVARALIRAKFPVRGSISFVGTVGEEGLGDLRGVKALFNSSLRDRIDRFISVDGDSYTVTNVGVGSRRYRVTYWGPGGHSYDDFGRASPVHALGLAIAAISRLSVPGTPRTTFTVGRVGGGTSINAIATEAWMEVDMRSSDPAALAELDAMFHASVKRALDEENERRKGHEALTIKIEAVGNRPSGRTDARTPMVETTVATLEALRLPVRLEEGSTDANLPMSLGIPALTIGGGGRSRDTHSPRESFDTTDSWKGTQLVTLLSIALTR